MARTVHGPAAAGAVYCTVAPVPDTVPHVAVHVTRGSLVPVTAAVSVVPCPRKSAVSVAVTVTTTGVTVTVAVPVRVGSSTLVAVTV